MSRQSWRCEQDAAITQFVQQFGLNDWSQIAASLKEHYPFSKRTGKQCRERWYNHLNPSVSKLPWTASEEHRLFQMHRNMGNRWKDISKAFPGRTDNDIKNHFYSTLRRSLRRLNKVLGQRNSTTQMREIKPSVLTTIMRQPERPFGSTEHSSTHLKDLPTLIFDFAHFKPVKKSPVPANIDDVKDRIGEIFQLISEYNQQYESLKLDRASSSNKRGKFRSIRSVIVHQPMPDLRLNLQVPQQAVHEQPKELPSTQIQIKEEPDNSLDYYVYNVDNQEREEQQRSLPQECQLHKNVSHMSLEAEQSALQFGDPQQPSRQSHGQSQSEMQLQCGGWSGGAEGGDSQDEWAGSVHM